MHSAGLIARFLAEQEWVPGPLAAADARFLAAGEYNENWVVTPPGLAGARYVLRVNHGSQLGLGERQIEYEFNVLTALTGSGVTPRPLFWAPRPEGFAGGVLLMDFLPGRPLRYESDADIAAAILAKVHAAPPSPACLIQASPVEDIAAESLSLLNRFPDHPLAKAKTQLLAYRDTVLDLAAKSDVLRESPLVMVNTEVNSHNFLIPEHGEDAGPVGGFLVDWEKAVVSHRAQDLGHFLAPTTTLWKTDYRFSNQEKIAFVRDYARFSGQDFEEMLSATRLLEKAAVLRGLSWCHMAHYEYTRADRALAHAHTLRVILRYLAEIPCFVG